MTEQFFCLWDQPYVGKCGRRLCGHPYCEEHQKAACIVCGGQSTHGCSHASQFVCGYPLCDSRECQQTHTDNHNKRNW